MRRPIILSMVSFALVFTSMAEARKSSSSSGRSSYSSKSSSTKSSSPGYGTGSKSSSTSVKGYTKKNGTYVAPAKRSTPDSTTKNNWSTKPNTNPYTGKQGTQVLPPAGR